MHGQVGERPIQATIGDGEPDSGFREFVKIPQLSQRVFGILDVRPNEFILDFAPVVTLAQHMVDAIAVERNESLLSKAIWSHYPPFPGLMYRTISWVG